MSRPNLTDRFPNRISHGVRAPFFGGGIQVPLNDRIGFFAEARMTLVVADEADGLYALAPLRAGAAWRFRQEGGTAFALFRTAADTQGPPAEAW